MTGRAEPAITGPRALVVLEYLGLPARSGGQKRALRLLEAIERAGATPHILTRYAPDESLAEASARGWAAERFPRATSAPTRRVGQYLHGHPEPANPALRRRLRALSPGAAFVQFEEIEAAQHLTGVLAATRTVVSLYNVDSAIRLALADGLPALSRRGLRTRYRGRRMARVERRASRRAAALLCVSEPDHRHFAALGARALLVPNGVDDDLFAVGPAPTGSEDVLFFGAFDWEPNLDGILHFLADGWPAVAAARPGARLRVAGPGPLDAVRAAAARTRGVEVIGFVDDLPAELERSRVVVVPIWVGGGTRIKVLEALAAARPVVGTPVGVEHTGFVHDRHGLISATPAGLAAGVVALLGDPARAERYGREGRELVSGQRWSEVTRPAEELYRRWLAPAGPGPWSLAERQPRG